VNIFLEAFVDTNFGDNLFVHTVAARYPQHTFYLMAKEEFRVSYELLSQRIPNLQLIEPKRERSCMKQMDGLMFVGGDMFWDGGGYGGIMRRVRSVQKQGGIILLLGQSLFDHYGWGTRYDLRTLLRQADAVVAREDRTAGQMRQLAPEAPVRAACDMAFAADIEKVWQQPIRKGCLGISVRRKIPRRTEDMYDRYCDSMACCAVKWLNGGAQRSVRWLALSTGTFDDRVVAGDIMKRCPKEYQQRMEVCAFEGDVPGYMEQIQQCASLLCTRFHALVFGMLLNKPLVPLIYEDKMDRLLDAVQYSGLRPRYEDAIDEEEAAEIVVQLSDESVGDRASKAVEEYLARGGSFFAEADRLLTGLQQGTRRSGGWYAIWMIKHVVYDIGCVRYLGTLCRKRKHK